jgi:signal transduction histidine kinase
MKLLGRFNSMPLRKKLIAVIVGISTFTVLFLSMLFLVYYVMEARRGMVQEMQMLADVIGDRSSAAILYDDDQVAKENLSALARKRTILLSCIYADKKLFASFKRTEKIKDTCPKKIIGIGYKFNFNRLEISRFIQMGDETIGEIYILADLSEIESHINRYLMFVGIFIVAAFFIAFMLSSNLQQVFTRPLFHLVEIARHVSESNDYSVRARKYANDEMGVLIDGFNRMLGQVEQRDNDLVYERDRAEAASKAKNEFLASMNHELRTPLNAIIGFAEIIKNELMGPIGNDRYEPYIEDIVTSGKHLLEIINDILDYSKLESGNLDVLVGRVNLNKTIAKIVRLMTPKAQKTDITLEIDMPEESVLIYSDERIISQILMNLISNAIKFSHPSNKVITRVVENKESQTIAISVIDFGIGIAEADIPKAMAPFGQVDGSLTRKYEGTGLGLPLSKNFTKLLGGEFLLQSELDKGTTVSFTLPKLLEPPQNDSAKSPI